MKSRLYKNNHLVYHRHVVWDVYIYFIMWLAFRLKWYISKITLKYLMGYQVGIPQDVDTAKKV